MKTKYLISLFGLLILINLTSISYIRASVQQEQSLQTVEDYHQYNGIVVDSKTKDPLIFATLSVNGTNISTVTNTEGKFSLKVPTAIENAKITVNFLGYQKKVIPLSQLRSKKNRILLKASVTILPEVVFELEKDAKKLVQKTMAKKGENYLNNHIKMTAFYRETIKKRGKNVSLAEAVVTIYKQPYTAFSKDKTKLLKSRKSTNYKKLDTIAVKLQGGPYNALYVDLMKYPEYLFTEDTFDYYSYTFAPSTSINGRPVYVVKFKQYEYIDEPLYYGTLFIDAKSLALTSAIFNLNVKDQERVSKIFVRKKPSNVTVIPLMVSYRVNYREQNEKWYYGYSNAQLAFKVKRKRKWFNSKYTLNSEMAVTDWIPNPDKEKPKGKERLRSTVIISDEVSGFSDPEFWGAYNVIEPEKSIESAIKKIKRQLKRISKS